MRVCTKLHRSMRQRMSSFVSNEDGANAVEFALVATPFFVMIFGLIGIAFNFFVQNSLENGMSRTSRLIRTGQAQANNWTINDFKNNVCLNAGNNQWIDCRQFQIFVQTSPDWASVRPTACLDGQGNPNVSNTPSSTLIADLAGGSSAIVIVTGCYRWTLTQKLPFVNFGNLSDRSTMMQTVTAFRAEPYTPPS